MRNRFDLQLKQLNDDIIEMGNMIERAIEMGVYALIGHDTDKAKQTIDYDMDIDHMERDIEALCMKLLLQQQPVAGDLRQISAALKMITDMERIGDQADDISEIASRYGLTENHTCVVLCRVRKQLKKVLEEEGYGA